MITVIRYNGEGGDITLPRSIDGKPVLMIGSGFLSGAFGTVNSIDIGAEVVSIDDDAFGGFNGRIRAATGSYAANWANEHGYTCGVSIYTLSFETNGGAAIADKTASADTNSTEVYGEMLKKIVVQEDQTADFYLTCIPFGFRIKYHIKNL